LGQVRVSHRDARGVHPVPTIRRRADTSAPAGSSQRERSFGVDVEVRHARCDGYERMTRSAGSPVADARAAEVCRCLSNRETEIGTQLDCDLAARQIVIGTQAPDASTNSTSLRPPRLRGTDPVAGERVAPAPAFALELQDIDSGTSLCQDTENERYCD